MKVILKITGKIIIWILTVLVVFIVISGIIHSILTLVEKKKYKIGQTIEIDGKDMQAYVTGSGDKTIVLLSGLGTASPIIDFMPLAERLSKDYKVVILEYFGYGFSDSTKKERSNENIVQEIRASLNELDIKGPYILMPHSMSGIYSLYYAINYPNEVEAIIGIDESVPNQTKVNKDDSMSPFIPLLNELGIIRDAAYLLPSIDDGMNINNYYTKEQIKLNKMAAAWNSVNRTVINEYNMGNENTKELYDVKYPNNVPVLAILATESVADVEWLPLHEELISNPEIQKIKVLDGGHYLHWSKADDIVTLTKEFISKNLR
ncbi:alpha/beta fold hydrolase [Lacrimispora sp.]|uniref:alpha/beta fold hydrolase n=1 Tax=Lacrimispora sp. TaxID=2719234 RepID=UPI0028A7F26F|nr:alpha/beta hydrolase [Lacrimispora sp.]